MYSRRSAVVAALFVFGLLLVVVAEESAASEKLDHADMPKRVERTEKLKGSDKEEQGDEVSARFGLANAALLKLKVRELKQMLARKGAKCNACSSKHDLIERIEEVREWPDKEPEPSVDASDADPSFNRADYDDSNMDETIQKIRKMMKEKGMDGNAMKNMKMFSPKDLEKMNVESTQRAEKDVDAVSDVKPDL
jgi:ARMET, C-terminal